MVQLGNESAQQSLRAPTITQQSPYFHLDRLSMLPSFWEMFVFILFRILSYFFEQSCLYVYYRYIEPQSYILSQNLSPLRHAFYVMNVQASFNFLVASSVTLEYLISLFYSFSPLQFQRLASSLFFFSPSRIFLTYLASHPFSFIGPRSSRLPRYYISVTLSGANSPTQMCFEISWKFPSFTLTGTQGGRLEIYLA